MNTNEVFYLQCCLQKLKESIKHSITSESSDSLGRLSQNKNDLQARITTLQTSIERLKNLQEWSKKSVRCFSNALYLSILTEANFNKQLSIIVPLVPAIGARHAIAVQNINIEFNNLRQILEELIERVSSLDSTTPLTDNSVATKNVVAIV